MLRMLRGAPTWPAAPPSGRLRRAGKVLSHVAQYYVQSATAGPPPHLPSRGQPWPPRGPTFESPLPARLMAGGGRASPPTEALAARRKLRACVQTSVGSPTSVPLDWASAPRFAIRQTRRLAAPECLSGIEARPLGYAPNTPPVAGCRLPGFACCRFDVLMTNL